MSGMVLAGFSTDLGDRAIRDEFTLDVRIVANVGEL
jgi:hypothetical protein